MRSRSIETIEGTDLMEPMNTSVEKQLLDMSKVGGDLGTLAFTQCLQNLNLLNQAMMKKLMGNTENSSVGIAKEDIKDIVKEIVMSIMKELGAEVK